GGEVKTAQIKNGQIKVKASGLGDNGTFPLPVTSDVTAVFTSGTTSYSMGFQTSSAKKNDTSQYLNKPPLTCVDCCSFTKLRTATALPNTTVVVGHVIDNTGANVLDLTQGGFYFGGSNAGVPLPSPVPNTNPDANGFAGTYYNVTSCSAGSFSL